MNVMNNCIQIGVYDPLDDQTEPLEWVCQPMIDSAANRRLLASVVADFNQKTKNNRRINVILSVSVRDVAYGTPQRCCKSFKHVRKRQVADRDNVKRCDMLRLLAENCHSAGVIVKTSSQVVGRNDSRVETAA